MPLISSELLSAAFGHGSMQAHTTIWSSFKSTSSISLSAWSIHRNTHFLPFMCTLSYGISFPFHFLRLMFPWIIFQYSLWILSKKVPYFSTGFYLFSMPLLDNASIHCAFGCDWHHRVFRIDLHSLTQVTEVHQNDRRQTSMVNKLNERQLCEWHRCEDSSYLHYPVHETSLFMSLAILTGAFPNPVWLVLGPFFYS